MDAHRLGSICRALRLRKEWRQADLARRAGVSESAVWRLESGRANRLRLEVVEAMVEALGGRIDVVVRWRGGDLDRLLNARHSALHESVARWFASLPGWTIAPEVSFAVYRERGVIDILAWHAATRTLLVIELKTGIVDVNDLMGSVDRKRRLAPTIGRERGWRPARVGVWVIVADSTTNRRRVRAHATTLRAAFPLDGRSIAGWLRRPAGAVECLSFWSDPSPVRAKSDLAVRKRVRCPVPRSTRACRHP